jgi:hypothetical protein
MFEMWAAMVNLALFWSESQTHHTFYISPVKTNFAACLWLGSDRKQIDHHTIAAARAAGSKWLYLKPTRNFQLQHEIHIQVTQQGESKPAGEELEGWGTKFRGFPTGGPP